MAVVNNDPRNIDAIVAFTILISKEDYSVCGNIRSTRQFTDIMKNRSNIDNDGP